MAPVYLDVSKLIRPKELSVGLSVVLAVENSPSLMLICCSRLERLMAAAGGGSNKLRVVKISNQEARALKEGRLNLGLVVIMGFW